MNVNVVEAFPVKTTRSMFFYQLINDPTITTPILYPEINNKKEETSIDESTLQKLPKTEQETIRKALETKKKEIKTIARFKKLILAISRKEDSNINADEIKNAYKLLEKKDLAGAKKNFSDHFKKKVELSLETVIDTDENLMAGFRAMEMENQAESVMKDNLIEKYKTTQELQEAVSRLKSIINDSNTNTEIKKQAKKQKAELENKLKEKTEENETPEMKKYSKELIQAVNKNMENKTKRKKAKSIFVATINALPAGDPERNKLIDNQDAIVEEIVLTEIFINHTKKYIDKNSDKGLTDMMKIYNDMKGLDGLFNISDKTKKIGKEVSILVLSIAATAGASLALNVIAGGARIAQM